MNHRHMWLIRALRMASTARRSQAQQLLTVRKTLADKPILLYASLTLAHGRPMAHGAICVLEIGIDAMSAFDRTHTFAIATVALVLSGVIGTMFVLNALETREGPAQSTATYSPSSIASRPKGGVVDPAPSLLSADTSADEDWRSINALQVGRCGRIAADSRFASRMLADPTSPGNDGTMNRHRVALVVGNGAYQQADELPTLKNPRNDARSVARALSALGFEVLWGVDLFSEEMVACLDRFYQAANAAEIALLYYAGHGFADATGTNAILPIDALFDESGGGSLTNALPVDQILGEMRSRAKSSLMFLDACRTSLGRGLDAIRITGDDEQHSEGSRGAAAIGGAGALAASAAVATGQFYYVYAAAPGATASDGDGGHSPFTEAFLNHVATPGQLVQELVMRITRDLVAAGERQTPYSDFSTGDGIYFAGPMTVQEIRAKSRAHAIASAEYRRRGARSEAIAEALKGVPPTWGEGDNPTFAEARAELFRSVASKTTLLRGGQSYIEDPEISPGGEFVLAIAASPDEAILWEVKTGRIVNRVGFEEYEPELVGFAPFGPAVILGSDAGPVQVVNAATGEVRATLRGHRDFVTAIAVSPDWRLVLAGSYEGRLKLWDLERKRAVVSLELENRIDDVYLSPQNDRFIVVEAGRSEQEDRQGPLGAGESRASLYDAETGDLVRDLGAGGSFIFSQDGTRIFRPTRYRANDNLAPAEILDAKTGEIRFSLDKNALAFEPAYFGSEDTHIYAKGDWRANNGAVTVINATDGAIIRHIGNADWDLKAVDEAAGKFVLADDNRLRTYDLSTGEFLNEYEGHRDWVDHVKIDRSGRWVVSSADGSTVHVWPAKPKNVLRPPGIEDPWILSLSKSGDRVQYVASDGSSLESDIQVFDATSREALISIPNLKGNSTFPVIWSGDGQRIAIVWRSRGLEGQPSRPERIAVVDVSTGEVAQNLEPPKAQTQILVQDMAFSFDGAKLAVGFSIQGRQEPVVRLYDVETGEFSQLEIGDRYVGELTFLSDDALLAMTDLESRIYIYELQNNKLLKSFPVHEEPVSAVAFHAGSGRLVTGDWIGVAKIWDLETATLLHVLDEHGKRIDGVDFTEDGKLVATASGDGSVKLWDSVTGELVDTLVDPQSEFRDVRFGIDGRSIAASTFSHVVEWEIPLYGPQLLSEAEASLTESLRRDLDAERVRYWRTPRAAFE